MRILIAGDFQFEFCEESFAKSLENLGIEVVRFAWGSYFSSFLGKLELYTGTYAAVAHHVNQKLLSEVVLHNIDTLLIWRGTHVDPSAIRKIRQANPKCLIISYNNDDPFSPLYSSKTSPFNQRRLWKRFHETIPHYDINFVYRPVNLPEYESAGSPQTHLLMPYFNPEFIHPVELTEDEIKKYGCDVVFVGHYESDGREACISALVEAGIQTNLYGTGWKSGVLDSYFGKIEPLYRLDYVKALTGASMCLCFLSKLNRDTYTQRCFEIPALGKLLLSERTADLANMFREDEEAVFFSSEQELVEKVTWLKQSPETLHRIAQAGMRRVYSDHSAEVRMRGFLNKIETFSGRGLINAGCKS
jgi:spore maturation protein CgeB